MHTDKIATSDAGLEFQTRIGGGYTVLKMIFIIVSIVLSLDQLTKFLVTRNLLYEQSIPVIKGIFHLTLIRNRGAAFGILKNQIPLFIFISIWVIILIYFNLKNSKPPHQRFWCGGKHEKFYRLSLSFILAGAVGNLIDRLFLGYVIDFLDFRIWPVFNVADSAITIGTVLLGWCILKKPETSNQ